MTGIKSVLDTISQNHFAKKNMNPLLTLPLTHRELHQLIEGKMTIKNISLAKRGYRPNQLIELEKLLQDVDEAKVEILKRNCSLRQSVQAIINLGKIVLDTPIYITNDSSDQSEDNKIINDEYLKYYKKYIDLKILYNKVINTDKSRETKNHVELIRLHQQIRKKHEKLSRMRQTH